MLIESVFITAPDGAYAGAPLIVTGGTPVAYEVGEYTPIIEDVGMIIIPYMFIINGVETGEWFVSPTTLPDDLEEGDTIQVKDAIGRLSNVLIATTNPLYSLTYTGQTLTYTGQTLTYNP